MILGFHSIFGTYGFWLPNDPRGSWSEYVANYELYRYGPATKVTVRHSVAHAPHDQQARLAAKATLKHPPVNLTGRQALAVANGFRRACLESGYVLHACAILPDHVHLVIGRHDRYIRRIVGHLKTRAHQQMRAEGVWTEDRPLWADHGWNVFLNDAEGMRRAIAYVEGNPLKEGKRAQRWAFVVPWQDSFAW